MSKHPKPKHQSEPQHEIVVEFEPQATINDRIVEVDPQGETTFTVDVAEALKLTGCTRLEEVESRTYSSDGLKDASTAPLWVRQWSGPFDCDVSLVESGRGRTTTIGAIHESYGKHKETSDEQSSD